MVAPMRACTPGRVPGLGDTGAMTRARRIQEALRRNASAGRREVRSGPFTLYVAGQDASSQASYAIPDAGARADPAVLAALRTAFTEQERVPRVELVAEEAPGLLEDLRAGDFTIDLETPVMVCEPARLQAPPAPEGVTLQRVDAHSGRNALRELVSVQRRAFAGEDATDADVDRMPQTLAGGMAVLARVGIEPAGGGMFLAPAGSVAEVAGVGVLTAFRGRGVATAITAELARLAFRGGAELAMLTPGSGAAGRAYARAGFAPELRMVHLRG